MKLAEDIIVAIDSGGSIRMRNAAYLGKMLFIAIFVGAAMNAQAGGMEGGGGVPGPHVDATISQDGRIRFAFSRFTGYFWLQDFVVEELGPTPDAPRRTLWRTAARTNEGSIHMPRGLTYGKTPGKFVSTTAAAMLRPGVAYAAFVNTTGTEDGWHGGGFGYMKFMIKVENGALTLIKSCRLYNLLFCDNHPDL